MTTADSPPPPQKGWRRYYTRTRAIVAAASAAILATLALLEGTLDLVDRFRDEPCNLHATSLGEPRLDSSVTRGQSLELSGGSTDGLTAERLAQPGKLVGLSMTAEGYRGERLHVWARVLTKDGAPVDELELPDLLVQEWKPTTCDDSLETEAWSPVPQTPGSYLIQIRLRTADRQLLGTARTPVFEVSSTAP